MNIIDIDTINKTSLRAKFSKIFLTEPLFVVDRYGKALAIALPYAMYQDLQNFVDDFIADKKTIGTGTFTYINVYLSEFTRINCRYKAILIKNNQVIRCVLVDMKWQNAIKSLLN